MVKTQDVGRVYIQEKGLDERIRMEFYQLFSQHLNLLQICIFNQAYIIPNSPNLENMVLTLTSIISSEDSGKEVAVMDVAEKWSKEVYTPALQYMDSHRDRLVLKELVAELASVQFASKLEGVTSRKGAASSKKHLHQGLKQYAEIRLTSQTVRSYMTTAQQYRLTERVISARKLKEIKTIGDGRGRKLKKKEFPE